MIYIKSENLVNADYYRPRISFFGSDPKIDIICGNCQGQFSSTDCRTHRDKDGQIDGTVVNCPYCGKWNLFPLVRSR